MHFKKIAIDRLLTFIVLIVATEAKATHCNRTSDYNTVDHENEQITDYPAICLDYIALHTAANIAVQDQSRPQNPLNIQHGSLDMDTGKGTLFYHDTEELNMIQKIVDQPKKIIQFTTYLLDANGLDSCTTNKQNSAINKYTLWKSLYRNIVGHHLEGVTYHQVQSELAFKDDLKKLFFNFQDFFISKTGKRLFFLDDEGYRLFYLSVLSINKINGKHAVCKINTTDKIKIAKLNEMAIRLRTLNLANPFMPGGDYTSKFLFKRLFNNSLTLANETVMMIQASKTYSEYEQSLLNRAAGIGAILQHDQLMKTIKAPE